MLFKTLLTLTILLTQSTLSLHDCSHCQTGQPSQNMCYNDGKVYSSTCLVNCKNPGARPKFACSQMHSLNECVTQCRQTQFGGSVPSFTRFPINRIQKRLGIHRRAKYDEYINCLGKCPKTIGRDFVCASDRKVYSGECHMKCTNNRLIWYFKCATFTAPAACERKCTSYKPPHSPRTWTPTYPIRPINPPVRPIYPILPPNPPVRPTYPIVPPSPPITPRPVITRPCLNQDWVCGSNGLVYWGTCDGAFNFNAVSVIFNCSENDIRDKENCRRICTRFGNDPCMRNCPAMRTTRTCYESGKVMSNGCLARCLNLRPLFECRNRNKRKCRRRCNFGLNNF